ncbi:putative SOS response-associated peptidase YedK [Novosphingobium sp. PhB165]|uniref:SOS response-associated peptidase n=1 Tax=Novosphingobium sp. PhB165 TaxID=2485105 RepID=UPI001043CB94|nr:SOS response-associated peptidase family protein [Novosphingobium sp. PhB165]TCM15055.1 putative SOS response-associated peptidase YedK [Novosphingobium sp. PhB165]
MCNLYTQRLNPADIAAHFGVSAIPNSNADGETFPGKPGMVVREENGSRLMQTMTLGFPLRLKSMAPTSKPIPVNNIAELPKNMWVGLARKPQWRCLIPLTGFAEAEGQKGKRTRTWFNIRGQEVFAWGGLWRESDEWGQVYSGAMTDCNEAIRPVHDRMPVLLLPNEYETWLRGSFEDLMAFQERKFPDELVEMVRTDELWSARKAPASPESTLL